MPTGKFKTRKRYRLTFVNENTFNAVWTLKLSRAKVWLLSGLCVAAIAALVVVFVVWTPVSALLPGYLKPSQRRVNVENTLRVDSLLAETRNRQLYVDNLMAVLGDPQAADTSAQQPAEVADTLIAASANEREFVREWSERQRTQLSVLTPLVAEGMMFRLPGPAATLLADGTGLQLPRAATVTAINDATVVDRRVDAASGLFVLTLQHANEFLSVYSGLQTAFAAPGQRVEAGQALGALPASGRLGLAIWRQGRPVALSSLLPL